MNFRRAATVTGRPSNRAFHVPHPALRVTCVLTARPVFCGQKSRENKRRDRRYLLSRSTNVFSRGAMMLASLWRRLWLVEPSPPSFEVHWVSVGGDGTSPCAVPLPTTTSTYADFVEWAFETFGVTPPGAGVASYSVSVCDTAESPRYNVALADRFTNPRGVFVTRAGRGAEWAVGFRLEPTEGPTSSSRGKSK